LIGSPPQRIEPKEDVDIFETLPYEKTIYLEKISDRNGKLYLYNDLKAEFIEIHIPWMKFFSNNNQEAVLEHLAKERYIKTKEYWHPDREEMSWQFKLKLSNKKEVFLSQIIMYFGKLMDEKKIDILLKSSNNAGVTPPQLAKELLGEIFAEYLSNNLKITPQKQDCGNKELLYSLPYRDVMPADKIPFPGSLDIDRDKQQQWIDAHSESKQMIAKQIINNLRYISFDEFKDGLNSAIQKFNDYLAEQPNQNYAILILAQPGKSFSWVTSLALDNLFIKPSCFIVYDDRLSPTARCDIINQQEISSNLGHIVILDDASYSGNQLRSIIYGFNNQLETFDMVRLKQAQLHTIIPFVSQASLAAMQKNSLITNSFYASLIENTPQELKSIKFNRDESRDSPATLTFFQHKPASSTASGPMAMIEFGSLLVGEPQDKSVKFCTYNSSNNPPYKKTAGLNRKKSY
jgi:hypothetical protein